MNSCKLFVYIYLALIASWQRITQQKTNQIETSQLTVVTIFLTRCDNIGALDLTKPSKGMEGITRSLSDFKGINGFTTPSAMATKTQPIKPIADRLKTPDKNIQLSNLQMLSKVAIEHAVKSTPVSSPVKKPPMPSLQTLKIPVPQNATTTIPAKSANMAKMPKLNEINKSQFRMLNPQMRNMRPNQNQSVRNIPNPSLLVRQQNQNRLNSLNTTQTNGESKDIKIISNESVVVPKKIDGVKENKTEESPKQPVQVSKENDVVKEPAVLSKWIWSKVKKRNNT